MPQTPTYKAPYSFHLLPCLLGGKGSQRFSPSLSVPRIWCYEWGQRGLGYLQSAKKEMIHTGNRPTQALNPAQRSAGPPQRQRDQRNPGRERAASLTCLLFIRRTSSRKSRDSMVSWIARQLAAKRARQNHREGPLQHWPGSPWTEPPDACTSASGAGAGEAPPFCAENGQRMTCEPPRTAQGLASSKNALRLLRPRTG